MKLGTLEVLDVVLAEKDTQGNYFEQISQPVALRSGETIKRMVTYDFEPVTLPPDPSDPSGGSSSSSGGGECAYAYGSTCLVMAGTILWNAGTLTALVMAPFSAGMASAGAIFGLFGAALLGVGIVLAAVLGESALQEAKDVLTALGETVKEIVDAIVDVVVSVVDAVVDFFKDLFGVESTDQPLGQGSGGGESSSGSGSGSGSDSGSGSGDGSGSGSGSGEGGGGGGDYVPPPDDRGV